ncbi:DUF2066 domain-containing protein [Hyphobacterium sp. HN65]|uniref:DUF2066 domain-containing protein n=1 Tax=Hyphobacterium lacteum TaxID=3116575 RepID=A0ABU7LLI3_9PROT|nr:DUF2066 domain-containing protein [Hyphobacterium sp. HN65]MEE2524790.1 DUF2066 domain-containing protein [Hyphobacterium sp. HN65]
MMRQLFAAIAAIVVWTGLAEADSPYTVVGVPIDATADNALEAQTIAMRRGQVAAVHALLARLTLPEDRLQVPEITNEAAAEMISGLQVRNEQRSATRYLGELTVSFDPRAVRIWLNGLGVPFVEGQAREILVLPVLQTASGNYWLWNTTNPETGEVNEQPWLRAWRTGGYQHALSPVSAPSGDAGRMLIDGNSAVQMNESQLRSVAQAYGVSRVAVMVARQGEGGVRVDGRLFSFDGSGEVSSQQIPTIATNTFRGAATRFVTDLENAWKAEAIVRGGGAESLNVTVLYNSLSEWRRLQNAITGTSLIRSAQLDAIAPTGAMMTLEFRGQFSQLQRELDARGARLMEDPDLGLVVRSR